MAGYITRVFLIGFKVKETRHHKVVTALVFRYLTASPSFLLQITGQLLRTQRRPKSRAHESVEAFPHLSTLAPCSLLGVAISYDSALYIYIYHVSFMSMHIHNLRTENARGVAQLRDVVLSRSGWYQWRTQWSLSSHKRVAQSAAKYLAGPCIRKHSLNTNIKHLPSAFQRKWGALQPDFFAPMLNQRFPLPWSRRFVSEQHASSVFFLEGTGSRFLRSSCTNLPDHTVSHLTNRSCSPKIYIHRCDGSIRPPDSGWV
jgi:hypothetical protein